MTGLTSLSALEGTWRLDRHIVHADGSEHRFEGVARFRRSGPRLIEDEEGVLLGIPGQPDLKATRRYIWIQEKNRIEVLFDDMRPFHTIPTGVAHPETTHLCPPDRYRVSYDFSDRLHWSSVWRVEGPRKSYVMTNEFRWLGGGDETS